MCCLFGLIDTRCTLPGKEKSKLLHLLASESEARGTDAAGVAYNQRGHLYIQKRPVPGHKLQIRVRDDTAAVMGHTRLTTQGRASRNRNNHPFFGMAGGMPFALAHNGVLYNESRLRRAQRLPRTNIETDSYIAVQLIEQGRALTFDSLRHMAEQVEGSFTFTVLDGADNLYIIKGDSPMCLYWFPEQGIYLYNSTEEILDQALRQSSFPLGPHTRISVSCGEILRIGADGTLDKREFDNPYLLYSKLYFPCSWQESCGFGKRKEPSGPDSYLEEIKSVAMAFGYSPADIDQLADIGFTPEELEELLYCGEL